MRNWLSAHRAPNEPPLLGAVAIWSVATRPSPLAAIAEAERADTAFKATQVAKGQPVRRKKLPEHFEHIDHVIAPAECACPDCGGELKDLGKPDEAEVLEVKTVTPC